MEKKGQEHDEKFKEVDLELKSHREPLLQLKQNERKISTGCISFEDRPRKITVRTK
ncbi:hypothetical protein IOC57_18130 [Bacillus sp. SD075]|uniref:hypothetical protein n=1 Tax=Bacillus sp. SD075 TaxID=2781732 RepID=UPI001A97A757|nr:hypothetical protein [Bacillus sp. SD075]MBO0999651.1 hypothetical protein [Bacillus sp. SD075]